MFVSKSSVLYRWNNMISSVLFRGKILVCLWGRLELRLGFTPWPLSHPQELLCMLLSQHPAGENPLPHLDIGKMGQRKGRGIETSFSLLLLPMRFKPLTALPGSFHVLHRDDVRRRTCLCCVIIALFSVRGSRRLKESFCLENHVFGSRGSYLC